MSTKRYKVTASVVRWEHSYDGVHWEYCYHGSESTCGAGERKRRQSWKHPLFDSWSPDYEPPAVKVTPMAACDTKRAERLERYLNWQWHKTQREMMKKELEKLAAQQAAQSWPQQQANQFYGLGIGDMLETPQGQELGKVTGVEPAEHDHACELRELKKQLAEVKQLASRAPIPSPPPPAPTGIVTKVDEKGFEVTFGAPPGKAHDFSNPYLVAHGGHLRCVDCGKPASSGLCVPDAGWRERWEVAISTAVNAQGLQPSPGEQTPQELELMQRQSHLLGQGAIGVWSLRSTR